MRLRVRSGDLYGDFFPDLTTSKNSDPSLVVEADENSIHRLQDRLTRVPTPWLGRRHHRLEDKNIVAPSTAL